MATITYPASDTVRGIWLFDEAALRELDSIIDDMLKDLEPIRQQRVAEQVAKECDDMVRALPNPWNEPIDETPYANSPELLEERKNARQKSAQEYAEKQEKRIADYKLGAQERAERLYGKKSRLIKLALSSGNMVEADRFEKLFHDPSIPQDVPTGFTLDIQCGETTIDIDLPSYNPVNLQISVSPREADTSAKYFLKLREWAKSKTEPKWQFIWHEFYGLQWFIFAAIFWVGFVAWIDINSTTNPAKADARKLLEEGMMDDNARQDAIRLSLAILSDYRPQETPRRIVYPHWLVGIELFAFCMAIALSLKPYTLIGIGLGKDRIAKQKRWISAFYFIIVTVMLGSVFSKWLASVVFGWVLT